MVLRIGIVYWPEIHSLLTVPYTRLFGSSSMLVTGSTDRWTSLLPPQTSSDVRVMTGPSSLRAR
jgi:hypothetical protein